MPLYSIGYSYTFMVKDNTTRKKKEKS